MAFLNGNEPVGKARVWATATEAQQAVAIERLEAEIERLKSELAEAAKSKADFLAHVAARLDDEKTETERLFAESERLKAEIARRRAGEVE